MSVGHPTTPTMGQWDTQGVAIQYPVTRGIAGCGCSEKPPFSHKTGQRGQGGQGGQLYKVGLVPALHCDRFSRSCSSITLLRPILIFFYVKRQSKHESQCLIAMILCDFNHFESFSTSSYNHSQLYPSSLFCL